MSHIKTGTVGLDESLLGAGYFPDDLPSDWRLGYYANDFSAILLRQQDWFELTADELGDMAGDVSASFRFFLEIDSDVPDGERLLQVKDVLGESLGGFLWSQADAAWVSFDDDLKAKFILPVVLDNNVRQGRFWAELSEPPGNGVVLFFLSGDEDMRWLRNRFEAVQEIMSTLPEVALLVSRPSAGAQSLFDLRTLLELMGMA